MLIGDSGHGHQFSRVMGGSYVLLREACLGVKLASHISQGKSQGIWGLDIPAAIKPWESTEGKTIMFVKYYGHDDHINYYSNIDPYKRPIDWFPSWAVWMVPGTFDVDGNSILGGH